MTLAWIRHHPITLSHDDAQVAHYRDEQTREWEETVLGERLLVRYDHDGLTVGVQPYTVKKL